MEFTSGSNDHVDESRQWLEEGEVEFASGTNDRTAATTSRPSDRARGFADDRIHHSEGLAATPTGAVDLPAPPNTGECGNIHKLHPSRGFSFLKRLF